MSQNKIMKIAKDTREASHSLSALTTSKKNKVLKDLAKAIKKNSTAIMKANDKDVKAAHKKRNWRCHD